MVANLVLLYWLDLAIVEVGIMFPFCNMGKSKNSIKI